MVESVSLIGDIPCHETVDYEGAKITGDPITLGDFGQLQCVGAVKFRRGEIEIPQSVIEYWEKRGVKFVDAQHSTRVDHKQKQ